MSPDRDVQLRYEIKMPLDVEQLTEFWSCFKSRSITPRKSHPERVINSIYLDSPDLKDYTDNTSGLSRRRKCRFRWYSDQLTGLRFEIKEKENKLSRKTVISLSNENRLIPRTSGVFNEFRNSLGAAEFRIAAYMPVLEVSYSREYFVLDSGVRITIDKDIVYRSLITSVASKRIRSPVSNVVEFKFPAELKTKATEYIQALPFRTFRHSKYVVGVDTAVLA